MKKYDCIALGELLVDMAEGEKSPQNNLTFEACPGGAPCNVLALLQKAGHKTGFIGKVGDDFLGHMLANTIEELGIDTKGLIFDDTSKTTLAFVHKKADGDRDFSFYRSPGADMMLSEQEVDYSIIDETRIFHFGTLSMTSEPVKSATFAAVDYAKKAGALLSFDPNLREPLWKNLEDAKAAMLWGMSQCDILKISDNEVQFITGLSDMNAGFEAIKKLTSAKVIFLTLGKDGSMGWAGNNVIFKSGVKVDVVVDTTGAGDTFFGCALHYILEHGIELTDDEVGELLELANCNASKITQVKGALKVMPTI